MNETHLLFTVTAAMVSSRTKQLNPVRAIFATRTCCCCCGVVVLSVLCNRAVMFTLACCALEIIILGILFLLHYYNYYIGVLSTSLRIPVCIRYYVDLCIYVERSGFGADAVGFGIS